MPSNTLDGAISSFKNAPIKPAEKAPTIGTKADRPGDRGKSGLLLADEMSPIVIYILMHKIPPHS